MSLLTDIYQLVRMRRIRKRDSKLNNGRCPWCGRTSRCKDWCWGPKIHFYLWNAVKNLHRPSMVKLIFRSFKTEVKWAGVEPWHRYN